MESEDEFLHTYFSHVSQLCYEKAKELVEKEKEPKGSTTSWSAFLNYLQQLALAEKSYMEIGFLQNKHKSFLRKDNSLKSIYETMKNDLRKLEEQNRQSVAPNNRIQKSSKNIIQYINARINLIDLYDKIYNVGLHKQNRHNEILTQIETVIEKNSEGFTDICLTPAKAVFSLECEILEQLFRALSRLQKLEFSPSLALIHGAHTRLIAWENKIQSREIWKLGIFKNSPSPALFQWFQKLKGAVLSKFSLFFHDILAQQTTPNEIRQLCAKLQQDYYQKIITFQKKYDATYVLLLSDQQTLNSPSPNGIIVSYPPRISTSMDLVLKMIADTYSELSMDKIIYKFLSQEQHTYIIATVESTIYLIILFENKKSEKDAYISNFVVEICQNLRCTKTFACLKNTTK
ncbi:unnamed protein product [Phyllotreta striolata]|uniref:Uncharacterized protein n=1 Tax=Phyllotreta striolata TaxID=444603 RepID=A0A9N9TLM4_PHYSR|nr:unnamed protein product [Phyllotreta striolata]